jgi:GWxTD domain-containing protein
LWCNRRRRLYNFNAEDYLMPLDIRNRPSTSRAASLAVLLLTCAALGTGGNLVAQSPTTSLKFVASDDTPSPLAGPYRTWLDQDVRWIIVPAEGSAYEGLQTNLERLQFIKGFWERRNPSPDSSQNPFKEEHYRRIAYANEHFAGSHPGWLSDRGRVYIVYGKPDSIDAHPSGGSGQANPFEVWHYNSAHSAAPWRASSAQNIDFQFTDPCRCGDYKLSTPLPSPSPVPDSMREKD